MTNMDFLEKLSGICSDPEFDNMVKMKKRKKVRRVGMVCVLTAGLMLAAALTIAAFEGLQKPESHSHGGDVLTAATDFPEATASPTAVSDIMLVFGKAPEYTSEENEWFQSRQIRVKQLSYSLPDKDIKTFLDTDIGANLIPTEVFGEHEHCSGVFYDVENDRIVCLSHDFLQAAGVSLNDGFHLEFIADSVQKDLFAVKIVNEATVQTEKLWVFNRAKGETSELPLPQGCDSFRDFSTYHKALCNGRLCGGVNTPDGKHFLYVYNTETKAGIKFLDGGRAWISGEFLSERILLIDNDGYSFCSVDTGRRVKLIGEYNYYADGKVFSVKNWGWAKHQDVEAAAYDAVTGMRLEGEKVLVQTVLDNGETVFLTKDTTTGEENVLLRNYRGNGGTWTPDGRYYYVFSADDQTLLCYSASDGEGFLSRIPVSGTEPMTIDDNTRAVFDNYYVSVYPTNSDVLIYYSRRLESLPTIPDYDEEKVDSPFWDLYREIKALNFAEETCFGFAVKENINIRGEGASIYIGVADMEAFRDILLDCFENGTKIPDKQMSETNAQEAELSLQCGFLFLDFFREDGTCYLSVSYQKLPPVGVIGEVYAVPETLLSAIDGCCRRYSETGSFS